MKVVVAPLTMGCGVLGLMEPFAPAEGVTVQLVIAAEQFAVLPPLAPAQVQVQGPEPLTLLGVPTVQRFVVGALVNVPPLDEPQEPLTGSPVKLATTVQLAVIGLVV